MEILKGMPEDAHVRLHHREVESDRRLYHYTDLIFCNQTVCGYMGSIE